MLLISARRSMSALVAALLVLAALPGAAQAAADLAWTSRTAPSSQEWMSIAYGNGRFVAVADGLSTSTGSRVMTSADGITWTAQTSIDDTVGWRSVTFGAGLFVAVGTFNDAGGRIMTSADGITWTTRASGDDDNRWNVVTYAGGQFVALARTRRTGSTTSQVTTSPDGTTWTLGGGGATLGKNWYGLTYGNGVFVATGGANAVMTSADGANWTLQSGPASTGDSSWRGATFANSLFVTVASSGSAQRVMTSADGVNWTARASANDTNEWYDVEYGDGRFVAIARGGTNRVMTSPDGITWTSQAGAPDTSNWQGLTYAGGQFVAVASSGFPNQVMTGVPAVSSAPWTLVRQALPMPSTGACTDVQDADYAWGTGLRGGWQRGWEPWVVNADGSRGGWACLRVLVNRGANDWVIDNSVA